MRATWFLTSALAALASAADSGITTVSYFAIDNDSGINIGAYSSTAARVVGIDKHATTYEVACMKGADKCALQVPATIIQGENTYSVSMQVTVKTQGAEAHATAVEACSFTHSSESASCSWYFGYTASAKGVTISTQTSDTTSIASDAVTYRALEVTDGVYALTAEATASDSPVKVTPTASAGGAGAAKPLITAAPLGAAAMAALAAVL